MKLARPGTPFDPWVLWPLLLAGVPLLTGLAHSLRQFGLLGPLPLTLELAAYASTLLAAAAFLSVTQFLVRSRWSTQGASAAAFAGVVELALLVVAARMEPRGAEATTGWPSSWAALIGVALACYLVIEAAYRDHRAAPIVLPLIAAAGIMQVLAIGAGLDLARDSVLRVQWALATMVLAIVGYGLLGAGAVLAAGILVRRLPLSLSTRVRRLHRRPYRAFANMIRANVGGLIMLAAAGAAWESWATELPRRQLFLSPIEPWALCVLVVYAGHLLLLWRLRPSMQITSAWAAILFCATATMLLGTMLLPFSWQGA